MKTGFSSLRKLAIFALATLGLAACSTEVMEIPPEPQQILDYDTKPYRIGVGDSLRIVVWRDNELSLSVPVRPDGKISMPLIGDVMAVNKTAPDLADHIAEQLTEFVRTPQVSVIVNNPASADFQHRVRITGAVGNAQSIPYRKGMTVLDVVLLAGGLNDFAAGNKALLYRKVEGRVLAYPVYINNILKHGRLATNYTLFPGDILSVPERRF